MARLTIGERLDENGRPISGTGFEYDSDGRVAELLEQRITPIVSQPQTGEWLFGLVDGESTNREFAQAVVIFRPGNLGPPEHIHPTYDEKFKILSGTFVFTQNGKEQTAGPGDELTVKKGVPHTFRCISDDYGALIGETWPAARTSDIIATLFGMAHEGKLGSKGEPKFLHAMVIGDEFAEDTVFTSPPPAIAAVFIKLFAPLGRWLGYQAADPRYREESFWHQYVNQPK